MSETVIVIERRTDVDGNPYYVRMRVVDEVAADYRAHAPMGCPAGHGPMRYCIEDDRLHCHCGAVATTHGNIIVDPDPVETKPNG